MTRFKGESPRIQSNSWWMQWAPGTNPNEKADKTDGKVPFAVIISQ